MKKIISAVFTGIIISAIATTTYGQKTSHRFSSPSVKFISASILSASAIDAIEDETSNEEKLKAIKAKSANLEADLKGMKAEAKALKASSKAATNFEKKFKDASNVGWDVSEKVISASFTQNDVRTDVRYDKKGNWLHTLLYYKEDKMPASLKADVKAAYPGYKITGVQEIAEGAIIFYIIHMESETDFLKLSAYDGELNVYKQYSRT